MKTILTVPLWVCFFAACRTTSGTYNENRDISEVRQIDSWKRELWSQSVIDSLSKKLSFSLRATITRFASVDSSGNQSVESITELNLTGEQLTEKNKTVATIRGAEETSREETEKKDKTAISGTTETDSRLFRPPDWIWLILPALVLWVIRKYSKPIKSFFLNLILLLKRLII